MKRSASEEWYELHGSAYHSVNGSSRKQRVSMRPWLVLKFQARGGDCICRIPQSRSDFSRFSLGCTDTTVLHSPVLYEKLKEGHWVQGKKKNSLQGYAQTI